jgi:23S rRNA (cytosine1962-C5)-methyltransferase
MADSSFHSLPRLRVTLSARAESLVRQGHPWVFDQSVRTQNRPGHDGEMAVVYDRHDRFLGLGFWDPTSPIRLRMFHVGDRVQADAAFWENRLAERCGLRRQMFGAGSNNEQAGGCVTTAYRCVHGENDGFPGLVIDRYGSVAVLKIYTGAWLNTLPSTRSPTLTSGSKSKSKSKSESESGSDGFNLVSRIQQELGVRQVVLRGSRYMEERLKAVGLSDGLVWGGLLPDLGVGILQKDAKDTKDAEGEECRKDGGGEVEGWRGGAEGENRLVRFQESGLWFEADVVRGQKTGFFLDQRENRRRVEALSGGCDVLNAFSFSGGFSVYAARGGARSVTDLDISRHALESAARNMALNKALTHHERIQADAFEWLAHAPNRSYDVVVLDPPSLAKREADRDAALGAYRQLAIQGWRCVRPGGWLVAASCSGHVSAADFYGTVLSAVKLSGRAFQEGGRHGHAADHPVSFPEAEYLKTIYLRAHPSTSASPRISSEPHGFGKSVR